MRQRLSAAFINNVKNPGNYFDNNGAGLLLRVDKTGYKRFVQRIRVNGRQRDFGLGSPPITTLAMAREAALENKRTILSGKDPATEKAKYKHVVTFSEAAERLLANKLNEFSNEKHQKQWVSSLENYAKPKIGTTDINLLTVADILSVLQPIWSTKTETAARLRQRIEAVLSFATVQGYRTGDNPARWKGNLSEILPKPSRMTSQAHQPSLALRDVSRWWKDLSKREGAGAKALQFVTLTAARSGEVRGMTWNELEITTDPNSLITTGNWTIPADRMKASREHRVPLPQAAIDLLLEIKPTESTGIVFASSKGGKLSDMTLSATMKRIHETSMASSGAGFVDSINKRPAVPHGIRSTFRDWAAENGIDRDMAELQLAHSVGSSVERAYRRTDLVERRRNMMGQWVCFLNGDDFSDRAGDTYEAQ